MFWRHHHHDCYHHHTWLSVRRGMVALFLLAFVVLGLLDYPHSHHLHRAAAHHSHAAAHSHRARRHRPSHAHEHRAQPRPRPTSAHHRAGHGRPAGHRHSSAGGTSTATADRGLTWTGFHGIQLPASATAGPRNSRGGLARGFTDTPQGALLAAVNIAVRTAADWGPAIFRPTVTSQVTGPGARSLLAADIRSYAQARRTSGGRPSQATTAVEEAYRFEAYAPAAATIDLVTSGPGSNGNPVLAVTQLRVIWRHRDWRLVAPPAGDWAKVSAGISSLAGFTIFPIAG
jgi:hypothetical protein